MKREDSIFGGGFFFEPAGASRTKQGGKDVAASILLVESSL